MASGISSTFRQVGIATGIALLGTLFSSKVHDEVLAPVAAVPGLSRQCPQIATAVQASKVRLISRCLFFADIVCESAAPSRTQAKSCHSATRKEFVGCERLRVHLGEF